MKSWTAALVPGLHEQVTSPKVLANEEYGTLHLIVLVLGGRALVGWPLRLQADSVCILQRPLQKLDIISVTDGSVDSPHKIVPVEVVYCYGQMCYRITGGPTSLLESCALAAFHGVPGHILTLVMEELRVCEPPLRHDKVAAICEAMMTLGAQF